MVLFLKNLLFTLVIPGTAAVSLPLWLVGRAWPGFGALQLAGVLVLAAGAAIYLWCVWDFATFGRGPPAPIDAPKHLVVRGLYHHVRNPMYVGVLTTILGWAIYFGSLPLLLYAAVIFAAFTSFVVFYEEPALHSLFGDEYDSYRRRVGRWLPRARG